MQTAQMEINWLMICITIEKQTYSIGGIKRYVFSLLYIYKMYIRIIITNKLFNRLKHRYIQLTIMLFLKSIYITEPSNSITNRSLSYLYQNLLFLQIHRMTKYLFFCINIFYTKSIFYEIFFLADNPHSRIYNSRKQNRICFIIKKRNFIFFI